MTLIVVCPQCEQRARSMGALEHYGQSDVGRIKQAFALGCPKIPQEVSPIGMTAAVMCPMAAARRAERLAALKQTA